MREQLCVGDVGELERPEEIWIQSNCVFSNIPEIFWLPSAVAALDRPMPGMGITKSF